MLRSVVTFVATLAALLPAAAQPKPADPLAAARQRLLRGNFAEARGLFDEIAKDPKQAPAAAIGNARCWRAEGEYSRALALLDDALKANPQQADLLAERGDLLYSLGRWDAATKDLDAALALNDRHFPARWVKARILRDRGDLAAADAEIRWFVREYTDASNADRPIADAETLLIVGQAGAENARWHNLPRQFDFILNDVYRDALKADPDCWQADCLAGRMLLEKHNRPGALESFDRALKINPRAGDALAGKGAIAFQQFQHADAARFAELTLKVNPKHVEALCLKADCLLAVKEYAAAESALKVALMVNPRDEPALARLGAIRLLQRDPAAFASLVRDVESFDAKPAVFFHELAECMDAHRRPVLAEEYFRKAAGLRPQLPASRAALGLLAYRQGNEAEARTQLDTAFRADPFNVKVSNARKVLKHLDGYRTIDTPHYTLRFDPKNDAVLAGFLAEYLEETHAELKRRFGYEPPGRSLVEVFRTHEMFSGRVVALPDLHTVGASTGRLVAIASPQATDLARPFNWARVVRHELTHVFNLAQTDSLVPHWLTEGLAVQSEGNERPLAWVRLLARKMAVGELLDLETMTRAFVQPRDGEEWTLAYCQSHLYVEYVVHTHGEAAIGKLLEAYRGGAATPAAVRQALGCTLAEFEIGYRKNLKEILDAAGATMASEKPMTVPELEAARAKNPDDSDIAARLSEEYQRRGRSADAAKLADAVLAQVKHQPRAAVVKARLLIREKKDAEARALLEAAVVAHPREPRLLFALGRLLVDAKDPAGAAVFFEQGRRVAPLANDWLAELARIYAGLGKVDELAGVLSAVAAQDADDLATRLKLAKLHRGAGRLADAERIAREALFIDVRNAEARALLLDVLKQQKKDAEAARIESRYNE